MPSPSPRSGWPRVRRKHVEGSDTIPTRVASPWRRNPLNPRHIPDDTVPTQNAFPVIETAADAHRYALWLLTMR